MRRAASVSKKRERTTSVEDVAHTLHTSIRAAGTEERRMADRSYLKMPASLVNYGVTVPQVTSIVKTWRKQNASQLSVEDFFEVGQNLWRLEPPVYDLRLATAKLYREIAKDLQSETLPFFEEILNTSGTWALIDEFATNVVPVVLAKLPKEDYISTLDRWSVHENFWVRRSCLLSHLAILRTPANNEAKSKSKPSKKKAAETDEDFVLETMQRFFNYAEKMLHEKEFFIQKSIGWILRDASRRRPDHIYPWVLKHAATLSRVTYNEAVKYLSAAQKAKIADARQ